MYINNVYKYIFPLQTASNYLQFEWFCIMKIIIMSITPHNHTANEQQKKGEKKNLIIQAQIIPHM